MNRREFINGLEEALSGEVSPAVLRSNLSYYRDYISGEIAGGRSEREVLDELGDPRLIARTIIEVSGYTGKQTGRGAGAEADGSGRTGRRPPRSFSFSWKVVAVVAAVVVLLFLLFTSLISLVLTLLRSPVLWVVAALWVIRRVYVRRRRR